MRSIFYLFVCVDERSINIIYNGMLRRKMKQYRSPADKRFIIIMIIFRHHFLNIRQQLSFSACPLHKRRYIFICQNYIIFFLFWNINIYSCFIR